ncbi:hypothetical protein LPJ61_004503 [Coemansia biformis]|uniref:Uncharacterized protein n=1 Tax=Coemansia biformis TaxID=1286918 RepID=A0A9W7Y8H1_9FUNG|nr:hypothetical protein LPJ61_004503 [Coemansia biformis]
MHAEMMANTPAVVFFRHEAMSDNDTFTLWPFKGMVVPTEDKLAEHMFEQVRSHQTMVHTQANACANCRVQQHWFEPSEWVMMCLHLVPTNLATLFTCQQGPFHVVACHGTTYLLMQHNGTPLPALVPGDTLMLYTMDDDMVLKDLPPLLMGDLEDDAAGPPDS